MFEIQGRKITVEINWKKISYHRKRLAVSALALLVFCIEVGAHFYMNSSASHENFLKERDIKLAAVRQRDDVVRVRQRVDSLAAVLVKNSAAMVSENGEKVRWVKSVSANVDQAALLDTAYTNVVSRLEKPVIVEYESKVKFKSNSFVGGWAGLAVGLLAPIFAVALAAFSIKEYGRAWYVRCLVGSYAAQIVSSAITAIAIYFMFGNAAGAIAFSVVIAYCAPLLYESVARIRKELEGEYRLNVADDWKDVPTELKACVAYFAVLSKERRRELRQDIAARRCVPSVSPSYFSELISAEVKKLESEKSKFANVVAEVVNESDSVGDAKVVKQRRFKKKLARIDAKKADSEKIVADLTKILPPGNGHAKGWSSAQESAADFARLIGGSEKSDN